MFDPYINMLLSLVKAIRPNSQMKCKKCEWNTRVPTLLDWAKYRQMISKGKREGCRLCLLSLTFL